VPRIKTWKRKPSQLWILMKQMKMKLFWLKNHQQNLATVTPGKKTQLMKTPLVPKLGTLVYVPCLTKQMS